MSVQVESNNRSFKAGADLSSSQFYIVKLSSGNVVLAAAATDVLIGVLQNKPVQNDTADVKLRSAAGTGRVIAGGTITAGDKITSNGSGKAITTTTGGDQILGYALESAVANDVFEYMPALDRV